MTDYEIVLLAAGAEPWPQGLIDRMMEVVRLAREDEREACAKLAETAESWSLGKRLGAYGGPVNCEYGCDAVIAEAIRARGPKP